jgi:outer membrane murein-binding lipoprotein Lpp
MNLEEQIGAIDAQIDQLSEFVRRASAEVERLEAERTEARAAAAPDAAQPAAPAADTADTANERPTLRVARPSHDTLTLTIGSQTVTLHPEQIGQLIEELANARASMTPEPPMALAPGWRFASTRNPIMAMQKQANGDRLLVARHTGHGWVPFTFSPDAAVQLYMMLTQR